MKLQHLNHVIDFFGKFILLFLGQKFAKKIYNFFFVLQIQLYPLRFQIVNKYNCILPMKLQHLNHVIDFFGNFILLFLGRIFAKKIYNFFFVLQIQLYAPRFQIVNKHNCILPMKLQHLNHVIDFFGNFILLFLGRIFAKKIYNFFFVLQIQLYAPRFQIVNKHNCILPMKLQHLNHVIDFFGTEHLNCTLLGSLQEA